MDIFDEIDALREERNAIILAHYYQEPDIQDLADFIGDFPDLYGEAHPALDPVPERGYPAGQRLAADLRAEGYRGLIYPSVRHPGGRCFVAFDPGIIQNVRPGASWKLVWQGAPEFTIEGL